MLSFQIKPGGYIIYVEVNFMSGIFFFWFDKISPENTCEILYSCVVGFLSLSDDNLLLGKIFNGDIT